MLAKILTTTLLKYFVKYILNYQVIVKDNMDPDDNFSGSSKYYLNNIILTFFP